MESEVSIKCFPALDGDCFLVRVLGKYFLIDGGYVDTYSKFLKPELLRIAAKGGILSHVIVSHIDRDHISGLIRFLEDNIANSIIPVESIWHNTYRHIQELDVDLSNYQSIGGRELKELSKNIILSKGRKDKNNISAKQGTTLGALALQSEYKWNKEFDNKAVSIDTKDEIKLADGVNIKILSPSAEKLRKLSHFWWKELYKGGFLIKPSDSEFYDDAFEFLVSQEREYKIQIEKSIASSEVDVEALAELEFPEDGTITNGSSISFIIESNSTRLLFLADSHPSVIIDGLKKHYNDQEFPIKFNLIKVSHHGSIANTSNELLQLIDSENYIFSTNGKKYSHPNIETVARIVARPVSFKRNLIFNYPLKKLHDLCTDRLKKNYNYSCQFYDGKSPIEIKF